MGGSVIADNWSLQNIAELLTTGIDDSNTVTVAADQGADTHAYEPLPQAAISLEGLFDLITDIVLQDQILVDQAYKPTWSIFDTELHTVEDARVIRPYEFLAQAEKLAAPRNELVARLCLTSSMRTAHELNAKEWDRARETPDRALSTTLWGGAGMLARAFIYEKGYTPHPLRRRLFQQAGVVLPDEDATARLVSTIVEKRASLSQSRFGDDTLFALRLNLPPLPILAIREAGNASQLLTIALQMRDKYQELRGWLGEYQQALTGTEGPSACGRFEKTLRSISTYIESVAAKVSPNAPTLLLVSVCSRLRSNGSRWSS